MMSLPVEKRVSGLRFARQCPDSGLIQPEHLSNTKYDDNDDDDDDR